MASTLVALQTVTVGAGGASSISFTSIPQTYNDLVIKASARSTDSGTQITCYTWINGDRSSIYKYLVLQGSGTAVGSASYTNSAIDIGQVSASSGTTSTFGNSEIYIPNYTGSTYKSLSIDTAQENNTSTAYLDLHAALYPKTDAVTSISISTLVGNFVQYSTFTLYGVYKDAAETTPAAPTIGTATAGSQAADVAFTPAGSGAPASSYVVTSSPGGLTATGGSSPIQIGGLTSGTAYTFTVRGQNPGGLGAASAASNSVTPYDGYESIATVTVGSAVSSVTFSSVPSTFTHLQIRSISRSSAAGSGRLITQIQFNSDTASNYSLHDLYGNGTSALASATASTTYAYVGINPANGAIANNFGAAVVDILDYANTNKFKTTRSLNGVDNNGDGVVIFTSGAWRSTSAISSITLTCATGNFMQYSTFELYGIRG
jgi:hypothetical protein